MYGAGQSCPAPTLPPSAHRAHATAHTPKPPTPEREHQPSKPGQRRRDHTVPPPPSERTQASTQTPTRTHPESANTQPNHPQANTPTASPCCHPHANTRAPTPNVWASKMCERGNPWQQGRPARTKRRHTTRARRQAHTQERANNGVCAVCRLRPQGRKAREKGRSQ